MITDYGKMLYLNSVDPVFIAIHSEDPTEDGSVGRIGTPVACVFADAVIGEPDKRYLNAAVEYTLAANANITHISVYDSLNNCLYTKPVTTPRSLLTGDKYVLSTATFIQMT